MRCTAEDGTARLLVLLGAQGQGELVGGRLAEQRRVDGRPQPHGLQRTQAVVGQHQVGACVRQLRAVEQPAGTAHRTVRHACALLPAVARFAGAQRSARLHQAESRAHTACRHGAGLLPHRQVPALAGAQLARCDGQRTGSSAWPPAPAHQMRIVVTLVLSIDVCQPSAACTHLQLLQGLLLVGAAAAAAAAAVDVSLWPNLGEHQPCEVGLVGSVQIPVGPGAARCRLALLPAIALQ
mmetsp:Transcript_12560/g.31922  ORF Transcript_12560/g.31922 Transcript_12560/m.31922 type:complete len:238 (-) Transcript_12560:2844-3557(-)